MYRLLLFLLLSTNIIRVHGQQIEKNRLRISNTDTSLIVKNIGKAIRLEKQDPDSAVALYQLIVQQSREAAFTSGIIKGLIGMGNIAHERGETGNAHQYFDEAMSYCTSKPYHKYLIAIYNGIATLYLDQGQFKQAIQIYSKAITLAEKMQYPGLMGLYANMGGVLKGIGDKDKAIIYYDKALQIARGGDDYIALSRLFINKGRHFGESGEYEKAMKYFDSAVATARSHSLYNEVITAMAFRMERYNLSREPLKTLAILPESLGLLKKKGISVRNRNLIHSFAGDAYMQLKKYKTAEKHLLLAKQNEKFLGIGDRLSTLHKYSELLFAMGSYKKAYLLHQKIHTINDSMKSKDIAFKVSELETRFRTAEKDKAITQSRLRISEQGKKIAKQNSQIWSIIAAALFLLMLLSWRYLYIRQKNKRLESRQEIEHLKGVMEGEQKERVRIATELHDGIVSELTAAKMNLERTNGNHTAHAESLEQLSTAINEVRNTAHNLMPEILLRYSLPQAVNLLCTTIQKTGRLDIEFQEYGDFTQLSDSLRQSVYRIVQELLHNIIKHSGARQALVQLSCYDRLLTVTIEDNGIGIDKIKKNNSGMGLANIAQRVKKEQGNMEWNHTRSGKGTNVHLEFEV